MGNVPGKVSAASPAPAATTIKPSSEAKKCKPCCACPETKKIRDECIMQNGQENCEHLIEAHKACMRSLGFNI